MTTEDLGTVIITSVAVFAAWKVSVELVLLSMRRAERRGRARRR